MSDKKERPFREFGERLDKAMHAAGLERKDIAAKLNVSVQMVGYWILGVHMPARNRILDLAELLKTTPEYLRGQPFRPALYAVDAQMADQVEHALTGLQVDAAGVSLAVESVSVRGSTVRVVLKIERKPI